MDSPDVAPTTPASTGAADTSVSPRWESPSANTPTRINTAAASPAGHQYFRLPAACPTCPTCPTCPGDGGASPGKLACASVSISGESPCPAERLTNVGT